MVGTEGIIRELGGIRALSNANLHTDSTIISLVFKSDYTLQLKEASAGCFMGVAAVSQGARRVFGGKGLVCGARSRRAVLVAVAERLSHELMLNMGGDA